jgi:hypothetical protein
MYDNLFIDVTPPSAMYDNLFIDVTLLVLCMITSLLM